MRRLLIANRGEIARRIVRTCRSLGIGTVAVYSDADLNAPHIAEADVAVRLRGRSARDTYLRADLLIAAARSAGADAVHPGYGFLSEDAAFAEAVLNAGLTWVGPPPKAIAAMGSKIGAKVAMAAVGVPVLPQLDPADAKEFPLLVKASAGGGGRGMRAVADPSQLSDALASAQQEALAAFGDGTIFCEPLLVGGRHIEVQVLADAAGTVWTLGERECSIQRRHQKIVEETPAPRLGAPQRAAMHRTATDAIRAIGYLGAGTVEFLLAPDGQFYFLETNTRLQVEHPVTECVYDLDLVAWQLAIAEGADLPAQAPEPRGHAIEVRLYAEDPARAWAPQSGTFSRIDVPRDVTFRTGSRPSGVRLDSGVEDGTEIGVEYDPLLAKVIAWGASRAECARRLAGALRAARLAGPTTNRDLLVRVLEHADFLGARTDIGFLERHDLTVPLADADAVRLSALAAALATERSSILPGVPAGWRNVPSQPRRTRFAEVEVAYELRRDGSVTLVDQFSSAGGRPTAPQPATSGGNVIIHGVGGERVDLEHDRLRRTFEVDRTPEGDIHVHSSLGAVRLTPLDRHPEPAQRVPAGSLRAPMPGTITRLAVHTGDAVTRGQPLLWLEAMKMEHRVDAPVAGIVADLPIGPGTHVSAGDVLAVLEGKDG